MLTGTSAYLSNVILASVCFFGGANIFLDDIAIIIEVEYTVADMLGALGVEYSPLVIQVHIFLRTIRERYHNKGSKRIALIGASQPELILEMRTDIHAHSLFALAPDQSLQMRQSLGAIDGSMQME